jgi:hypothetical protein
LGCRPPGSSCPAAPGWGTGSGCTPAPAHPGSACRQSWRRSDSGGRRSAQAVWWWGRGGAGGIQVRPGTGGAVDTWGEQRSAAWLSRGCRRPGASRQLQQPPPQPRHPRTLSTSTEGCASSQCVATVAV